ncbi:MAG: HEAT repeat domain-containing protein [Planctomycetota bacterium]
MKCDFSKISHYVDGQLNERETAEVKRHLKHCAYCATRLRQLTTSLSYLRQTKKMELPQDFNARLSWRLNHEIFQRMTRSLRFRVLRRKVVNAAVVIGATFIIAFLVFPELLRSIKFKKTDVSESKKIYAPVQEPCPEPGQPKLTGQKERPDRETESPCFPSDNDGIKIVEPPEHIKTPPEKREIPDTVVKSRDNGTVTHLHGSDPQDTYKESVETAAIAAAEEVERLGELLVSAFETKDTNLQMEIVRNLSKFDIHETYTVLQKVLSPEADASKELRKEALFSLSSIGSKDGAKLVLYSIQDKDWEVRDCVPFALSRIEKRDTIDWLAVKVLPSQTLEQEARTSIAWALGRTKAEVPIHALASALEKERDPMVRYAVCEALGHRKEEGSAEALLNALSDQVWYVRDMALIGLSRNLKPEYLDKIVLCLSDPNSLVKESAAEALSKLPDSKSVSPLVKTLRTRNKRLYYTTLTSLAKITGEKFLSESEWKNWLKTAGEFPEINPAPDAVVPGEGQFLDVPIYASRVVFMIDCSFSMEHDHKLSKAKKALKKTIESLSKDVSFNIIAVDSTYSYFSVQFAAATAENKRRAIRFIDSIKPSFEGKNLYDTLLKCFSLRPDEIFILTDGIPTKGIYTDPVKIVREVTAANAFQKTRINTIGFFSTETPEPSREMIPVGPIVDFLHYLAENNFGTFSYEWFPINKAGYDK